MTAPTLTSQKLPTWGPWAAAAASLVISVAVLLSLGTASPAKVAILAATGFVMCMSVWSILIEGSRVARDRLATTLITGAFVAALIPLVSLIVAVIAGGAKAWGWQFLTTDMSGVFGAITEGGAVHAIIGTLQVTAIATAISVPVGLLSAIYLVEYGRGAFARVVRMLVDVMTGIPSIVAGLFAYAAFLAIAGPAYKSAIIGGVGLAVLMTPVVVRTSEEMLALVPQDLREAALALGVPAWVTTIKVTVRTAIAGLTTGIMLAIARVIGETAPLLVTVGFASGVNWNAFDGRLATLPVYVYRQYAQGGASLDRAWAGALTLIVIVMTLNLAARAVSRRFGPTN